MLKTLLVIPPKYGIDYPPLGTPALLGYLKSNGIEAEQVDWNMEYCSVPSPLAGEGWGEGELQVKRNTSPYSQILPDKPASEMPYGDNTYSSYFFIERLLSSPLFFQFINDSRENPFHRFILENKLIDEIIKRKAGIIGLSIISPSQVLFSFTLGHLLKQSGTDIHVVIGGQWVSLYRKEILKRKDFMAFFDSAIFFDGETPLLKLIHELSNGGDLSGVPNLIYRKDSNFVLSNSHSVERLNDLPCPDFDGLPLNKYKTASDNKISLTFETSRECYWNKCVYCVDLPHPKQGYRVKSPSLVVRDIKNLIEKHHLKKLIISDPAMSPAQMRRISEKIIKEGMKVSWWCFARLDKHFIKDIFELAKKAGCHAVSFGMETANQRLLDFLQKGINIDTAKLVLQNCHEAGLEVQLQMMLGLPTETVEEGLETITFLVENRKQIQQVTFNVYYLTPGCLVYENPAGYGITPEKDPLPFQFFVEFSHNANGISKKEAYKLIRLYNILTENMFNKNIFLMENHNDALLCWRETGQKNKILVHADSHFDFAWITDRDPHEILNAKSISDFRTLAKKNPFWNFSCKRKDELTHIGNYICPAIKENIVREFYWVVPDSLFFSRRKVMGLKREIDEIIKLNPEEKERLVWQDDYLVSKICNIQLTICRLKDLPRFNEDVLLDIDVDYFIDNEMAWLSPDSFIKVLKEKGLKSTITTIAYSVEGGFTPIGYKFFGGYLNYMLNAQKDEQFEKAILLIIKALDNKKNKSYKEALHLLKEADACYPDYPPVYFQLSNVYYELGYKNEALDYYRKAVSQDTSYRTLYNNRGPLLEDKGKLKEAEDEYKKMLELDPDNSHFLVRLGNIYRKRKRWDDAMLNYNKALKTDPNNEEAVQNIGYIQMIRNKPDSGMEMFKKALSLKPDNPFTHSYLGLVYMKKKDYNEAMRETRRAVNSGLFTHPPLRWRLVFIYFKKGLYDRMIDELRAALIVSYFDIFWRIKGWLRW